MSYFFLLHCLPAISSSTYQECLEVGGCWGRGGQRGVGRQGRERGKDCDWKVVLYTKKNKKNPATTSEMCH